MNNVIQKFDLVTELFIAGIRVVGIIFAIKGISELGQAWTARDNSGIAQGVGMIIGGLIAVFAREILATFGITI